MASMIDTELFRGKAAASHTTSGRGVRSVDETQKRLGAIETLLAEIKIFLTTLATKTELEQLRGDSKAAQEQLRGGLLEINAVLPHLATKADFLSAKEDIAKLHASMIKWVVGTMISCTAAAYSVARLFG